MQSIISQLNRRYATKTFDPDKKIAADDLHIILESLRLSPSSFGLQGRGFVLVENTDLRTKIKAHGRDQQQIVDASHLLVLCTRTDVDIAFVDRFIASIADTRGQDIQTLDGYKNMILGFLDGKSQEWMAQWLTNQVYITAGVVMSACAQMHIDACPMEGFDPAKINEILGLADKHLASCLLMPIGYRSGQDTHAHDAKVRFPEDQVIVRM